jgi:preprotein translocase subunit SecA
VYGTAGDFQGDILRSEFMRLEVRGKRPFDIVCVDEVDSMLIDGRSNSIQLSGPMPAMNHLELTLATAWSHISQMERHLVTGLAGCESRTFYVTEEFRVDENKELSILSGQNLDECLIEVEDVREFLEKNTLDHLKQLLRPVSYQERAEWNELKQLEERMHTLQDEWGKLRNEEMKKLTKSSDETEEQFQARVKQLDEKFQKHSKMIELQQINDEELPKLGWVVNKRYPFLEIPAHLREFATNQVDNWVKNALAAKFKYAKGKHYDVSENGRIIPIDYSNTGVLHDNMVWSDGLCQFLQIKEGLKVRHNLICR